MHIIITKLTLLYKDLYVKKKKKEEGYLVVWFSVSLLASNMGMLVSVGT